MSGHHHHHHESNSKGMALAFFMNLGFSIIELIGGFLTNSTAIIADSFHDFMDAVAIGIAVLFEKLSNRKRTEKFSYGFRRFNLLSAFGLSIFLIIGVGVMIYSAVNSFIHPEPVQSIGMLGLSILGLTVNGFAFLKIRHEEDTHNVNKRAVMLHLLEDVLGWIAVFIGSIIIYFTHWYWIDGVLAIGIALFISYNAIDNIIQTFKIMLQYIPDDVDAKQLEADLKSIESIEDFHDLHIWTMDGNYHIASVHVIIKPTDIKDYTPIYQAVQEVMSKHHIIHPTIQIEHSDTECILENC
ncbi:MAG: cation diffusion facilitator family transporter [Chitinophagales bacterium]|nr:cation diffusion facilitator family transporter [Chitinophagales bacterium]